jgi:hypothetical protein
MSNRSPRGLGKNFRDADGYQVVDGDLEGEAVEAIEQALVEVKSVHLSSQLARKSANFAQLQRLNVKILVPNLSSHSSGKNLNIRSPPTSGSTNSTHLHSASGSSHSAAARSLAHTLEVSLPRKNAAAAARRKCNLLELHSGLRTSPTLTLTPTTSHF